ncbi:hypothetical protein ORJ00_05485 [Rheinheimera baltica]|uniref:hypothetical protein n=1 Tax=Rheinheimera baltica TaxID=67576 RepID=UPI00273D1D07|nr:hypothetical protein [Rheinheimera baltica]MDP5142182.1 hypothetical protein [Rheinheimera baltica]
MQLNQPLNTHDLSAESLDNNQIREEIKFLMELDQLVIGSGFNTPIATPTSHYVDYILES